MFPLHPYGTINRDARPRFLLGFLQGGFIPDVVLYLSYFYTKNECNSRFIEASNLNLQPIRLVPIRLAFFWVSNYLTHIVSAFLAVGILRLRGHNGQAGWRYLFLLEGVMTCLVGLISFAMMPPGPTQTKAWYRPKGWFSARCVLSPQVLLHPLMTIQRRSHHGEQVRPYKSSS